MATVRYTEAAREDLIGIWRHIAADSPQAADGVLDRLGAAAAMLVDHPKIGAVRDDIRPGLRYLVSGSYLLLYRLVSDAEVEIVRVVHGHRDLFGLF